MPTLTEDKGLPAKRLIIVIGPAGSGKTTYYKKYHTHHKKMVRVSADECRSSLYEYDKGFDPEKEPSVWQMVWFHFMDAVRHGQNIFLDNTNLTTARRLQFVHIARCFNYEVKMIIFRTPLRTILTQNQQRKRIVPEKIICQQVFSFQYPQPYEYDYIAEENNL